MPTISFVKSVNSIEIPKGANLRESLIEAGIPVASSCAGVGVCAKCGIIIVKGMDQLSEAQTNEIVVGASRRLSCQVQVLGDITIDATYW